MATQYRPRVSDPEYFTPERVEKLTLEARARLETCAPSQMELLSREETLNWMYRVWRPHASYGYMERVTVNVMVNNLVRDYQEYRQRQEALIYHAEPRIDMDPQSTIKASYKHQLSEMASRPEMSFEY